VKTVVTQRLSGLAAGNVGQSVMLPGLSVERFALQTKYLIDICVFLRTRETEEEDRGTHVQSNSRE
jgi:hypothetical protein